MIKMKDKAMNKYKPRKNKMFHQSSCWQSAHAGISPSIKPVCRKITLTEFVVSVRLPCVSTVIFVTKENGEMKQQSNPVILKITLETRLSIIAYCQKIHCISSTPMRTLLQDLD